MYEEVVWNRFEKFNCQTLQGEEISLPIGSIARCFSENSLDKIIARLEEEKSEWSNEVLTSLK